MATIRRREPCVFVWYPLFLAIRRPLSRTTAATIQWPRPHLPFANCCLYLIVMKCLWRRFLLYSPIARTVSRSVTILRPIPNGTFLLVSRTLRAPTRSTTPASTTRVSFVCITHFLYKFLRTNDVYPSKKNILFEHNSYIVHPSAMYVYTSSIIFASTLSTVVFVFRRSLTSIRVGKKQRLFARTR